MKDLENINLGVGICGSFCTFSKVLILLKELKELGVNLYPIMSPCAYTTTTRFMKSSVFNTEVEAICGRPIIHTIVGAEPMGPKNILDAMLIAPCTGNTLSKLSNAVTDTPVLLAAKSLLRNKKPVIISVSTNDGLGINLQNIGKLIHNQSIFFVPFGQDSPTNKPYSLISDLSLVPQTVKEALNFSQLQPILTNL